MFDFSYFNKVYFMMIPSLVMFGHSGQLGSTRKTVPPPPPLDPEVRKLLLLGVIDPEEQNRLVTAFQKAPRKSMPNGRASQQQILDALRRSGSKSILPSDEVPLSPSFDVIDPHQTPENSLQKLQNRQNRKIIWQMMDDYLSPKQKQVLIHRYGLESYTPKTLQKTGTLLTDPAGDPKPVSQARVSQLQWQAERRLRYPKIAAILKPLIDTFD